MLRIRSGGQSGADRTALEIARELGLPTGGWCPLGCRTDDGLAPELVTTFGLTETIDRGYQNRTRYNVRDSDGTVLFGNTASPGCLLTIHTCIALGKPYLENPTVASLVSWLTTQQIRDLNVAGNRRRTNPEVVYLVRRILKPALEAYCAATGQTA